MFEEMNKIIEQFEKDTNEFIEKNKGEKEMKNNRKTYRLIDKYEGEFEILMESDSLDEITKYARYYDEKEVDGECYLDCYKLISEYQYVMMDEWRY